MSTPQHFSIYDSAAQQQRVFEPIDPANVRVYLCGPTVQSGPHIGHLRGALAFDILHRWLRYHYQNVTLIRNVTDIDDKVLDNASESEPWWALAYRIEQEFNDAYRAVGVLPPSYEPRATAAIPEMIKMIEELIERGHAYVSGEDVYFSVRSWPRYGELTNQNIEDFVSDEASVNTAKRDPLDFALWKGHKADEAPDAAWPTPWGSGRPGWHIECSAMARRFLGDSFDIHGGGLDLRFPHHENELAQSLAAGVDFAKYWVHNGLVTVNGQKMSKSLGNYILAKDLLAQYDPLVVRYALIAAHYRSNLDVSEQAFVEAKAALNRIAGFLERSAELKPADAQLQKSVWQAFEGALNDDLAVPQALSLVFDTIRQGNIALDAGEIQLAADAAKTVQAMTEVLGINPLSVSQNSSKSNDAQSKALTALVEHLINERATARAERDWGKADQLRDVFKQAGIILEDTPEASNWSIDE